MQHDFDEITRAVDPQRQQLERRSEARRKKVMRKNPETGRFMLAMSDEPTSRLGLRPRSAVADAGSQSSAGRRSRPESSCSTAARAIDQAGDIDIVAVLPTGVWAIDIQRHEGSVVELRHRPSDDGRRDFFVMDGVDCTSLLDEVDAQAAAVSRALDRAGFPGITCASVLCLIDAQPTWRGHVMVGETYVSKARPMLKAMADGPVILDETDIASLGLSLDRHLPRKYPLS